MRSTLALGIAGTLCMAAPVLARQTGLANRLDERTRTVVAEWVERARASGLPVQPLNNKALEGASKGASGERIIDAVARLFERLASARAALGAASTEGELVAAAAVLDLGLDRTALERLRAARPAEPITGALIAIAFLMQRGAPEAEAVEITRELLEAGLSDGEFARLRRLVEQDVRTGAPAVSAAAVRARALLANRRTPLRQPWS